MPFYKVRGRHYFGDFVVEASHREMAKAQAMDILTAGLRANGGYSDRIESYITSVEEVDHLGTKVRTYPSVKAGEVWKDSGLEYVVMNSYDKYTYKTSLMVKCPTNTAISLTPERFFANHPHAVKVHPVTSHSNTSYSEKASKKTVSLDLKVGEVWYDAGTEYVVIDTGVVGLRVTCPSNKLMYMTPDGFSTQHPYSIRVHSPR